MTELTEEEVNRLKASGNFSKFSYENDEQWTNRIRSAFWVYETHSKPMLDEVRKLLKGKE